MRWSSVVGVVAFGVTGCGPDPSEACEAFVDAYTACISQAWADDPASRDALLAPYDERYCEGADELSRKDARRGVDEWTCLADAYAEADCTGHNLSRVDSFACSPPYETEPSGLASGL